MNNPKQPVPRTTGIVLAALQILDVLTTRKLRDLPAEKSKAILECLELHPTDKGRCVDDCRSLLFRVKEQIVHETKSYKFTESIR